MDIIMDKKDKEMHEQSQGRGEGGKTIIHFGG